MLVKVIEQDYVMPSNWKITRQLPLTSTAQKPENSPSSLCNRSLGRFTSRGSATTFNWGRVMGFVSQRAKAGRGMGTLLEATLFNLFSSESKPTIECPLRL